ncbi:MAG: DUF465 domain-containing protein [Thermodesulfovibrionales bacterium]|nr:DUF465 domain-containing protein [Thermodesulfovibrionales bacterium]
MSEEEIVGVLDTENEEFKALHEEHRELKAKLAEMKSKIHFTPEEEIEKKNIQKLKLAKKDRMAVIIKAYKESNA